MRKIALWALLLVAVGAAAQSNKSNAISIRIKKEVKPALIEMVPGSIAFVDADGNQAIDAGETCSIRFSVKNSGMGDGYNCVAKIEATGSTQGITCKAVPLAVIPAGSTLTVEIPVVATAATDNGQLRFRFLVEEPLGFGTEAVELTVDTRKFMSPLLRVVDYTVTGASGNVLAKKKPFDLQLLMQNVEQGLAEQVEVRVSLPQGVFLLSGEERQQFATMQAGETKSLEYSLIVNQNYAANEIPIKVSIREKHGKFAENRQLTLQLNQTLASHKIEVKSQEQQHRDIHIASLTSKVDKNIPVTNAKNDKTFAVVVANEHYQNEAQVPYALNDGQFFRTYCESTLGIPAENIHYVADASLNNLKREVNWLAQVLRSYQGEARAIFYYAGHGVPNESNRSAYLLPTDGTGSDLSTGYLLDNLYATLGDAPSKGVTVFLDACFSGSKREGDMMTAARGVAIRVRKNAPVGNIVAFSAAQGDETAYQNEDERHGLFTYYLLEKLQATEGDVTYGELSEYIISKVSQRSIVKNGKPQTPSVTSSAAIGDAWKNWKFK